MADGTNNFPIDYHLPLEAICYQMFTHLRSVVGEFDIGALSEPLEVSSDYERLLIRWIGGEHLTEVEVGASVRLETVSLAAFTAVRHVYANHPASSPEDLFWFFQRLKSPAAEMEQEKDDCTASRNVLPNLPSETLRAFVRKLERRIRTEPLSYCNDAPSYLLQQNFNTEPHGPWSQTLDDGDSSRLASMSIRANYMTICEDGSVATACAGTKTGDLLCTPPCFQKNPTQAPVWMVVRRTAQGARLIGEAKRKFIPYFGRCPAFHQTIVARLDR